MKVFGKFLLVLTMICMASAAKAKQNQDLKTFIDKFEAQKRIEKRTGIEINWGLNRFLPPWGPYTKRPFSEGVNATLQKKLLTLSAKGMCEEIKNIELQGFLALYPHLKPAMKRQDVRDVFYSTYFTRLILASYSLLRAKTIKSCSTSNDWKYAISYQLL